MNLSLSIIVIRIVNLYCVLILLFEGILFSTLCFFKKLINQRYHFFLIVNIILFLSIFEINLVVFSRHQSKLVTKILICVVLIWILSGVLSGYNTTGTWGIIAIQCNDFVIVSCLIELTYLRRSCCWRNTPDLIEVLSGKYLSLVHRIVFIAYYLRVLKGLNLITMRVYSWFYKALRLLKLWIQASITWGTSCSIAHNYIS